MALHDENIGNPFSPSFRTLIREMRVAFYKFIKIYPDLQRVIATPDNPPDFPSVEVPFPILVLSSIGEGFPKQYTWVEAQLVGSATYQTLEGGRNSKSDGLAINRVELLTGFGTEFGPYGQPLTDDPNVIITVLEVASGSPSHMILETNDSGIIVPVFEAYNPFRVECAA